MKMKYALVGLLFLSGCATITSGTTQQVSVSTSPEGADCFLSNVTTGNAWAVRTPGVVTIDKSREPIILHCTKAGYVDGWQRVKSKVDPMEYWGGAIGAMIDAGNGAAYVFPAQITVILQKAD